MSQYEELAHRLREIGARQTPLSPIIQQAATAILSLQKENEGLREVVSACASALPNGAFIAPSASLEFMEKLPAEIASVVSRLPPTSTQE